MKRLITAVGTNELNKLIKEKGVYEVVGNDIPYQDGVLDILKENSNIEILVLSETLPGEEDIRKFIRKTKEINPCLEIMFFMKEMNEEIKNFLTGMGINKIFVDRTNSLEQIINEICQVNREADLNLEIERLRKMIEEKETAKSNEKKNVKSEKGKKIKLPKTVAITGAYGSGKSAVTAMLAKTVEKLKMRVIIIDFDIFNKSIGNMFNVSKYNKNYKIYDNINQCIAKVNNYLSVFSGIDLLFNESNKISFEKIKKLVDKLKDDYDLILIDTSSETTLKYVKTALVNSEKIIFLMEPNLIEVKKAQDLLEVYIEDWEIPTYKIEIVLNKVNINSMDDDIISNLFDKFKIIGKINSSKLYTILANNVDTNMVKLSEYEKILRKIG